MDPQGRIYSDRPDKIPEEDKARLDGFLRGRAEAAEEERIKEKVEQLERQLQEEGLAEPGAARRIMGLDDAD
jgi:hypothetical protein